MYSSTTHIHTYVVKYKGKQGMIKIQGRFVVEGEDGEEGEASKIFLEFHFLRLDVGHIRAHFIIFIYI